MSFSFRNLFSQDEGGDTVGDRSGGATPPQNGRSQEYEVSELLPFIPPAIVAQSGIPVEQKVHVTLPEDGSYDVRLSTIYQTCPALFAAEITPLNDSTISLPPKVESSESTLETLSQNSNPFADAADPRAAHSSEESSEVASTVAVGEDTDSRLNSFESPQLNNVNNPFGDFGDTPVGDDGESNPAPFSSALQDEAFGRSPELPQSNPFADAGSFEEMISKPQAESESGFPANSPADSDKAPEDTAKSPESDYPFESAETSFSTLFSQKADDDNDLPVSDESPIGNLFKEATGSYIGPPDLDSSPASGDLNSGDGFESFIPSGMEVTEKPEATPPEDFKAPLVFSDDASEPVEQPSSPPAPPVFFSDSPTGEPSPVQEVSPFGFPPRDEESSSEEPSSAEPESPSGLDMTSLFGGKPGESTDESPSPFQSLTSSGPDSELESTIFPTTEQPPELEQPSAEEQVAAAEQAAAEKAAAEKAAAEQAAAEKAAAEKAAAEKAAAEKAAAEKAAAEKAVAEKAAAEKAGAEKAAAEEKAKAASDKIEAENASTEEPNEPSPITISGVATPEFTIDTPETKKEEPIALKTETEPKPESIIIEEPKNRFCFG